MLDLGSVTGFHWDAGNVGKNARHGVSDAESEQVFFIEPLLVVDDHGHSGDERRFKALGRTIAGRRLFVCFTLREGGTRIRVISSRDMSRKERVIYEKQAEENS
jgi:uncharacterized protein